MLNGENDRIIGQTLTFAGAIFMVTLMLMPGIALKGDIRG